MSPIRNKRYLGDNNEPNPDFLKEAGPFVNILVHVPSALADLLSAQNMPVPAPMAGLGLLDTGASHTCVHEQVLTDLGLNPIGTTVSRTAGGEQQQRLYPVRIELVAEAIDLEFSSVAGVNLAGQTVTFVDSGEVQIIALIGRDLMREWLLVYNGPLGVVTIGH